MLTDRDPVEPMRGPLGRSSEPCPRPPRRSSESAHASVRGARDGGDPGGGDDDLPATLRAGDDVDRPAATFTASRHELLGTDVLLGSAELARIACRTAALRISVLAVTGESMRRVDAFVTDDAVVTHAMTPERTLPTVGSLCDRRHAAALLGSILDTLLAPLPGRAAGGVRELSDLGSLSPRSLPAGIDRLAIVTATGGAAAERWVLAVAADGLAAGPAGRVGDPVALAPITTTEAASRLRALLGAEPADPPLRASRWL